jgi:hypothetical protein
MVKVFKTWLVLKRAGRMNILKTSFEKPTLMNCHKNKSLLKGLYQSCTEAFSSKDEW